MSHLTLIKLHPCVQLGHLYEHIFVRAAYRYLASQKLYSHLDYDLVAKTYHNGVIFIDLEAYTQKTTALARLIENTHPTLDKEAIDHAATELLAEKQSPLHISSLSDISQELDLLDKEPWDHADTFTQHDPRVYHLTRSPLYIDQEATLPARKLTVTLSLDSAFIKEHRQLLPLFRQLAWLFMANIQNMLPIESPYFSREDTFQSSPKGVRLANIFNVAHGYSSYVSITNDLTVCLQTIHDIIENDGVGRLVQLAQDISYADNWDAAPNLEANCEDTLLFTGGAGWRHIATRENYAALMAHMQCGVTFGGKHLIKPLSGS